MIIHLSHISWLAVLAGSLAFFVLGGLWFGLLFGKAYATALGRPELVGKKPAPLALIGPFFCNALVTLTNALLMQALAVSSCGAALEFGAVTGLGYLGAMTVNIAINPNFPRPLSYGVLNAPYFLLGNLLNCLILTEMS